MNIKKIHYVTDILILRLLHKSFITHVIYYIYLIILVVIVNYY